MPELNGCIVKGSILRKLITSSYGAIIFIGNKLIFYNIDDDQITEYTSCKPVGRSGYIFVTSTFNFIKEKVRDNQLYFLNFGEEGALVIEDLSTGNTVVSFPGIGTKIPM